MLIASSLIFSMAQAEISMKQIDSINMDGETPSFVKKWKVFEDGMFKNYSTQENQKNYILYQENNKTVSIVVSDKQIIKLPSCKQLGFLDNPNNSDCKDFHFS